MKCEGKITAMEVTISVRRKVVSSIPDKVIGFVFNWPHYGPGVESASNRNEYLESFWE
jgi:hypothetical protein